MDVRETLRQAVEMGASDIFIIAGLPLTYKVDGRQRRMEARLMPALTGKTDGKQAKRSGAPPLSCSFKF